MKTINLKKLTSGIICVLLLALMSACSGNPEQNSDSTGGALYQSREYNFEFEYNAAKWVGIDSLTLIDGSIQTDFFEYSAVDSEQIKEQLTVAACIFTHKGDAENGVIPNFNILITPDTGGTIDDLKSAEAVSALESYLIQTFAQIGIEPEIISGTGAKSFGNNEFMVVQVNYTAQESAQRMFQALTIMDGDTVSFTFSCSPEAIDTHMPDIEQFLSTFKYEVASTK